MGVDIHGICSSVNGSFYAGLRRLSQSTVVSNTVPKFDPSFGLTMHHLSQLPAKYPQLRPEIAVKARKPTGFDCETIRRSRK
jgi:hypothetical protein